MSKHWVVSLCIIGLILSFTGCSSPESLLEKGDQLIQSSSYEKAAKIYQQAIDKAPDKIAAYSGLAEAYYHLGNAKEAIDTIKSGYAQAQDDSLFQKLIQFGHDQVQAQNYDQAVEYYQAACDLVPNAADAEVALADTYYHKGDYQKANTYAVKGLESMLSNQDSKATDTVDNWLEKLEEHQDTAITEEYLNQAQKLSFANQDETLQHIKKYQETYQRSLSPEITYTIEPSDDVKSNILTIKSSEDTEIYYTVDGSTPTKEGFLYTEPIPVKKFGDIQIKAAAMSKWGTFGEPVSITVQEDTYQTLLQELYQVYSTDGLDAAEALLRKQPYQDALTDLKERVPETEEDAYWYSLTHQITLYAGETKDGLRDGVGVAIDNLSMIYLGNWKDGVRDGNGFYVWIAEEPKTGKTVFTGEWKDDMPNGYGELYQDFGNGSYSTVKANFKNGVYHGTVQTESFSIRDNTVTSYTFQAVDGLLQEIPGEPRNQYGNICIAVDNHGEKVYRYEGVGGVPRFWELADNKKTYNFMYDK